MLVVMLPVRSAGHPVSKKNETNEFLRLREGVVMSTDTCDEKNSCPSCEQSEKCSQDEKQAHEQKLLDERMSSVKVQVHGNKW